MCAGWEHSKCSWSLPRRPQRGAVLTHTPSKTLQSLPASDVTTISVTSDFGGLKDAKLTLEINGHQQPMGACPCLPLVPTCVAARL